MSEKVDRCKFFLMTGISTKIVPSNKECNVCPLRNEDGDCPVDIMNDYGEHAGEKIGRIWRDFFEKRSQKVAR